ncbi:tyrosine-type recombinase/integrase, partial [Desulfosarcina cetonica]|uniref:tyrosine-type recombinase/integrase n=1 Tax=Desulfosarcina cetonica TaxID=90730 RepID=UPI0006CF8935
MPAKWIKSTHPGVRYREHPTRTFKRQKDRYFEINYRRQGKPCFEALGWLSDGMTAGEAATIRGQIVQNIKKGVSPQSIKEMREMAAAAQNAENEAAESEKREAVTFGEMAGLFLEWSADNKKSALQDKIRYEKHLAPRFKDTPIKDISPFHLEKLKSSLKKKKLSPGTITQYLQLTRAIFRKTKGWGHHDCDFPKVDFPKVSNQRVAFLTQDQAAVLLDAVKNKSIQLWCQCVLSLYAGLRFKEVASLELSDLDFEAGTIHVRDSKGGTRHAYITEPIRAMFNEWWTFADKKPGLIFPAYPGGRNRVKKRKKLIDEPKGGISQIRVSPVFHRTVDELGLNDGITDHRQKIVFHTLRHTFASWLVMGGESLQTVKELMGHADITT